MRGRSGLCLHRIRRPGRRAGPAPHHALEDECVGDLQQHGRIRRAVEILERGVEQVDVHDAAFGARLFRGVQHLNVVAQPERAGGEDQQGAEQVGEHAPRREEGDCTHGSEAGECRPQHGGRNPQPFQHQQHGAAHDDPAHQAVDGHHELDGPMVVAARTFEQAAQRSLQQHGQHQDEHDLDAWHDDVEPLLHPVGKVGAKPGHGQGMQGGQRLGEGTGNNGRIAHPQREPRCRQGFRVPSLPLGRVLRAAPGSAAQLLDGIHLHLKAEKARAALGLGGVERFVRAHQHGFGAGAVVRHAGRDAPRDREARTQWRVGVRNGALAHELAERAGEGHRPGARRVGQDEGEFLAAVPCRYIPRAHAHLLEQPAHFAQAGVALDMAHGVVEALEVVEVAQHQRERHAVAARGEDLAVQDAVEAAPVDEAGEGVHLHHLVEALVGQVQFLGHGHEPAAHVQQAPHGAQLGDQHDGLHGLDEVVVPAGLDAAPDIQVAVQARQEDDRCPPAGLGLAHLLGDPVTVFFVREPDVQQHQVGAAQLEELQGHLAGGRFHHVGHSRMPEFAHERGPHGGLVFDDHDGEGPRRREGLAMPPWGGGRSGGHGGHRPSSLGTGRR